MDVSSKKLKLKAVLVRLKLSFFTLLYGLKGATRVVANEINKVSRTDNERLYMVYLFSSMIEAQLLRDVFKLSIEELRQMLQRYYELYIGRKEMGVM